MRLSIATPLAVLVDGEDVTSVRAEDETGSFAILPGHADFLTTLAVSVVTWRGGNREHQVAVRGGVLIVENGGDISIVTRDAVGEETFAALGRAVLERLRQEETNERASRLVGTRMELAAMRQIERYLATGDSRLCRGSGLPDGASLPDADTPSVNRP